MRKDPLTTIIQRVYGKRYHLDTSYDVVSRSQYYASKIEPVTRFVRERRVRIVITLFLGLLIGGSIYCFNLLVQTQQDVFSAGGKVDALKQRRNDISINLSKAVFDYSTHERSVFTAVVGLRSLMSKKGVADAELVDIGKRLEQLATEGAGESSEKMPGADGLSALNRLMAGAGGLSALNPRLGVAEQYPDLKLSKNFESLMAALVEVEKDLAVERIKLNDSINTYTTLLLQFPTNFYAWVFKFKDLPYFEATIDARHFQPIGY